MGACLIHFTYNTQFHIILCDKFKIAYGIQGGFDLNNSYIKVVYYFWICQSRYFESYVCLKYANITDYKLVDSFVLKFNCNNLD